MKRQSRYLASLILLASSGCYFAEVTRPVRLYNLTDGRTIEVFLQTTDRSTGKLLSAKTLDETFQGEFVIYTTIPPGLPSHFNNNRATSAEPRGHIPANTSLSELYGFAKESNARPAGSAVLVGSKATVIEIIFYKVASDLRYGDGVARDNKGFFYRVFLSEETQ